MRRPLAAALVASLFLAAASASAQAPAAALTRIGAAAAVQGRVNAQAPGAAVGRVVQSGKPIFLNDHVTTDAAGRLQVLLLDETVFTLGPDSDMVLDEFVYDPATNAGKVAARMTKGVFRFVTGKVARRDPASMKVRLPAGTIGIRGTIVLGEAGAAGSTAILLGPGARTNTDEPAGAIVVENNGVSRFISEPGKGVTIAPGQAPSAVQDLSSKVGELSARLEAPPNLRAQNASAGAAGGSAAKQSGQDTASAHMTSGDALAETQSQDQSSLLFTQAAQSATAIPDGPTTWEDIRSNVTVGDGFYFSGHAPISCTGAGCINNAGSPPVGALQLYVNFAARTIGGATAFAGPSGFTGSFIHTHNITAVGDTIQQLIGAGGSGLQPMSFASGAASGPAVLTLQSGANMDSTAIGTGTSGFGSGNFNGTAVTIQNAGGVAAANAKVNLVFTGTNSLSQSLNQSGTFLAPR